MCLAPPPRLPTKYARDRWLHTQSRGKHLRIAACANLFIVVLVVSGAAEVMRHPWLRPVEFELLRRGVPLPAPFVPDSRLVYARDDLAGGPRSKGGVDDAPAEGAADGEATIDVAGWEFHGGGWKDELQEYASKARL